MQPPNSAASDDRHLFQKLLGFYDAPAFVRRAKRVEDAERILAEHLDARRRDNLTMVRLRVGQVRSLAGTWEALRPLLATDDALDALRLLHDKLEPELRLPPAPTTSVRTLRSALAELTEAVDNFNRRWKKYVAEFDLAPINQLRDGYNRHYLIEKECAVGDSRVSRMGFQPLDPLTVADLFQRFPLLSRPHLAT